MTTRMLTTLLATGLALAHTATAGAATLQSQQGPYEVQVLVGGAPVRSFYHDGETYVLGQHSDRYTLRVWNHSGRRIEAVVSVDGRDVVDGKSADFRSKRGYLVQAWGHVDIEGWRLSSGQAAAFRFSSVAGSYAARTGSARDVGVVGVAVFPERYVPPQPVYVPRRPHYPYEDYEYRDGYGGAPRSEAPADSSPGPAAPPPAEKSAPSTPYGGSDGALGREHARANPRPGLGTAFGEAVDSPVQEVAFIRQSATQPSALLGVRYNDREGLYAMGIDVDGWRRPFSDTQVRRTATPFPVVERGYATPPPGWEY